MGNSENLQGILTVEGKSAFSSMDREKNKIDIEEENSGGDDLKKYLVQVNTGISNPFSSNIKVCSNEEGNNVIDHLGFEFVLDESPQAVGHTQNSVGDVGLIEQRNSVSICSHFLKTLSISGLEKSLQVYLAIVQEDISGRGATL